MIAGNCSAVTSLGQVNGIYTEFGTSGEYLGNDRVIFLEYNGYGINGNGFLLWNIYNASEPVRYFKVRLARRLFAFCFGSDLFFSR
jgi:hypothetical protein